MQVPSEGRVLLLQRITEEINVLIREHRLHVIVSVNFEIKSKMVGVTFLREIYGVVADCDVNVVCRLVNESSVIALASKNQEAQSKDFAKNSKFHLLLFSPIITSSSSSWTCLFPFCPSSSYLVCSICTAL